MKRRFEEIGWRMSLKAILYVVPLDGRTEQ